MFTNGCRVPLYFKVVIMLVKYVTFSNLRCGKGKIDTNTILFSLYNISTVISLFKINIQHQRFIINLRNVTKSATFIFQILPVNFREKITGIVLNFLSN